jgi:phosphatidate phosphatase PAH1
MDIVVVKGEDGSLKSSPFHIRFGTLKILKAREKIVDIYVNGEKTNMNMKLSSSGDAFFVQERKLSTDKHDKHKKQDYLKGVELSSQFNINKEINQQNNDSSQIKLNQVQVNDEDCMSN